jgi:RNA polymerase sigma-70 factor, ECF subfamily
MSHSPATVSPSNEELATRAQTGCAASFATLVRRFQTPVLHFLQHRGSASEAEDVLQETFLRAYANLARYSPQWQFSTWLFTIARRLSINHNRRQRPMNDEEAVGAAESPEPGPVESASTAERRRRLWSIAVRTLSEEEWTMLWMHYVEEMPAQEIGRLLDRSRAAVKTMMFRARKKLLPLVKDLEPEGAIG